eukprot:3512627-Pyramimonas_sp.AAC.1
MDKSFLSSARFFGDSTGSNFCLRIMRIYMSVFVVGLHGLPPLNGFPTNEMLILWLKCAWP